jgi:hypothetical protein
MRRFAGFAYRNIPIVKKQLTNSKEIIQVRHINYFLQFFNYLLQFKKIRAKCDNFRLLPFIKIKGEKREKKRKRKKQRKRKKEREKPKVFCKERKTL